MPYKTLEEFIDLFPKEKPPSIEEFIKNAVVKVHDTYTDLSTYLEKHEGRDVKPLYKHIIEREKYLTEFYKRSLELKHCEIQRYMPILNNNIFPQYKNYIRNIFLEDILLKTKSGFKNIDNYLSVLYDLYAYPHCIIDYKLLTHSGIWYSMTNRIGSVFSSFYFRASIMNPAFIHVVHLKFFKDVKKLFTPTLGWCSYLSGFSLSDKHVLDHYVGVDVIPHVCNEARVNNSFGLYPPLKKDIYMCPSENLQNTDFLQTYDNYFDLVFFSPPYFKMELYEGEFQSTELYKTYDEWLQKYWRETVILCQKVLNREHGLMTYIISRFDKYNLPNDLLKIASEYFTLDSVHPIYNRNVNSTRHEAPNEQLFIFKMSSGIPDLQI